MKKIEKKRKEKEVEKKLGEKIDKVIKEYDYKKGVEIAEKKLDEL